MIICAWWHLKILSATIVKHYITRFDLIFFIWCHCIWCQKYILEKFDGQKWTEKFDTIEFVISYSQEFIILGFVISGYYSMCIVS